MMHTHIGIKLSNEAGEIVVFEVFRQHEFGELRRRPHHESIPFRVPRNYPSHAGDGAATSAAVASSSLFFLRLEEIVSLGKKWGGALDFPYPASCTHSCLQYFFRHAQSDEMHILPYLYNL